MSYSWRGEKKENFIFATSLLCNFLGDTAKVWLIARKKSVIFYFLLKHIKKISTHFQKLLQNTHYDLANHSSLEANTEFSERQYSEKPPI